MIRLPPSSTLTDSLCPYSTLVRSERCAADGLLRCAPVYGRARPRAVRRDRLRPHQLRPESSDCHAGASADQQPDHVASKRGDRSHQTSAQPYKPPLFVSPTAPAVRPTDETDFGRGAAPRQQPPDPPPRAPHAPRPCIATPPSPTARPRP